ncbi:lethal (2) giant discs 1 [Carabus blaptoides fortunei]
MFSRKKEEKPKKNHSGKNLAQYGLFDVPTDLSFDGESGTVDDDDDSDLEAELLALTTEPKAKPRARPKAKPVLPAVDLDSMVASSMRDIASDEELSGDDDDPDLMAELQGLTGEDSVPVEPEPVRESPPQVSDIIQLLDQRLKMYTTAEENARKAGDTSRARRFTRGIKTLRDLIKQASAGQVINNDDIPPEVSVNVPKRPAPTTPILPTASEPSDDVQPTSNASAILEPAPPTNVNQELLTLLNSRKTDYKMAALAKKKAGDVTNAVAYMKIAKQFDTVIRAVENGEPVDLSKMPGPPGEESGTNAREENETQQNTQATTEEEAANEAGMEEEVLITAGSVGEALEQRLLVYKKQEETAKAEENSSKARRMGRIVKQYEQAIKQHRAGKPIAIDELPTPPGYAAIPVNPPAGAAAPPRVPTRPAPAPQAQPTPPRVPPRQNSTRKMGNQVSNTHLEKQVALLLHRQKEFKEAALQAKRKGEIAQAKELLKTAKGFDNVIEAARCGLPVDMDSLPIPASSRSILDEGYEVVLAEECVEDDAGTLEMLTRLEEQLTKQLKMCLSTRDHHKAIGDVAGLNRFENLALSVTKDLDTVRLAYRTGTGVPKFHYEQKSFTMVKCCTDLNDNDVEVVIVRGINYNCTNPKEVDTYVKMEFPWPQEESYKERTGVIKDTNNPEYNATFTVPMQRTSRQCQRVFKRHAVKLEVYSRGGFFRSDTLLGTVTVKLQPLETQCELHDSFDIMDGRKKTGGKLEVRIRVRHPLVTQQVEQINEKWLLVDH